MKLIKFEENLKLNKSTKFDMEAPRKTNSISNLEEESCSPSFYLFYFSIHDELKTN